MMDHIFIFYLNRGDPSSAISLGCQNGCPFDLLRQNLHLADRSPAGFPPFERLWEIGSLELSKLEQVIRAFAVKLDEVATLRK